MEQKNLLFATCYISEALIDFDQKSICTLVHEAAKANELHGISGYLCVRGGHFFQYIEGPSLEMNNLITNLGNDPRHRILTSIDDNELDGRRFPSWRMRYLEHDDLDFQTLIFDKLLFIAQAPRRDTRLEKMVFEAIDHFSTKFSGRHLLAPTPND